MMNNVYSMLMILVIALVTMSTRFIPFLIFDGKKRHWNLFLIWA